MVRRIFLLIVIFVLVSSVVYGFSFDGLLGLELNSLVVGSAGNRDPSISLSRPVDTQVVSGSVTFKWRYFDPEGDELEVYILQIDDHPGFYSPVNFKGYGGDSQRVVLEEGGRYYWRVQVKNRYGETLSDVNSFYFDPNEKVCDDGTPFFECSGIKPNYCDSDGLEENCQKCGCEFGDVCQADGSCLTFTCVDGTAYGSCSSDKPRYCLNGKIEELCSLCGCPFGLECQSDGSCKVIVLVEGEVEDSIFPGEGFLTKVALFFKGLFGR